MLAMFNKGVRKISIALNDIVEESEKAKLLTNEERSKAEKKAAKLNDVTYQTLDEDAEEGAKDAMSALQQ